MQRPIPAPIASLWPSVGMSLASLCKWKRARRKRPPGIANLLIGAAFLNRFRPGQSKESPAEAGFERLDEPETPRLKAGAKKSPLKRAEAPFQKKDFWILLMNYPKFSISGDPA